MQYILILEPGDVVRHDGHNYDVTEHYEIHPRGCIRYKKFDRWENALFGHGIVSFQNRSTERGTFQMDSKDVRECLMGERKDTSDLKFVYPGDIGHRTGNMIHADIQNEEGNSQALLDATLWFEQASDHELDQLYAELLDSEYASDCPHFNMVKFFAEKNPRLKALLPKEKEYSVAYNVNDILAWLPENRPQLLAGNKPYQEPTTELEAINLGISLINRSSLNASKSVEHIRATLCRNKNNEHLALHETLYALDQTELRNTKAVATIKTIFNAPLKS